MVIYELQRAARYAARDAQRNRARREQPTQTQQTEHARPKPTKRELRIANATTMPVKRNGALDLRHASKREPEGARYLDMTRKFLEHWGRWPDEETLTLATLFVAMTHFVDDDGAPLFTAVPLFLLVGKHGSGKTRLMQEMRALARNPTAIAVRYTMPGLRDALHNHMVPFLDEAHRAFGGRTGTANQALQSVIVGAYKEGTGTLDGIGGLNEQTAYGPILLAAQPQIMNNTNDQLEDLFERSIVVETEKSYDDIPPLDDDFRIMGEGLNNVLDVWGAAERPIPAKQNPHPRLWPVYDMPAELQARTAEIAAPMLAVADRAIDHAGMTEEERARWAIKARDAVVKVFKGHGNDPSTLADEIEARMNVMGL